MIDKESNHKRYVDILLGTGRAVTDAIETLEGLGFFEAPASASNHLAEAGGLCQHSLNVYDQAMAIRKAQISLGCDPKRIPEDSVAIVSLFHDVCKAEIYSPKEKFRKDDKGKWERYQGWEKDCSLYPLGHGEKSVMRLLRWGVDLDLAEMCAIRWHMAAWDLPESKEAKDNFSAACQQFPLLPLLIAADELATRITEVRDE